LGDIVKQQKVSNLAALELAARMKDILLRNMVIKARRNIKRGLEEPPYAFIVSLEEQHDILAALKMLENFLKMDVKIHVAKKPFKVGVKLYPKGTYVIFTTQPYRALVKYMLEKTIYPDNEWTRKRDGTPMKPYDTATFTVPDYLGVKVDQIDEPFSGDFKKIVDVEYPKYTVGSSEFGYLVSCVTNGSYALVNELLNLNYTVHRILKDIAVESESYPMGSFYIPYQEDVQKIMQTLSDKYHVAVHTLKSELKAPSKEIKRLRVGVYQRYYGGNTDEGWTRWILEQYNFLYKTIKDEDIQSGKLSEEIDLLILPDDYPALIVGEKKEDIEKALSERWKRPVVLPPIPPEYMSGIKKEGTEKLKEFVEHGGILLTFNKSCEFAIKTFKLPIFDASKKLDPKTFFCPSTILNVNVDKYHPLCYGMPKKSQVMYHDSMILQVIPGFNNDYYQTPITYPETDIMKSGWLIGEKYLSRKPALIEAKQGDGKVILYGFRPQFRAQTLVTFKTIFNAILRTA